MIRSHELARLLLAEPDMPVVPNKGFDLDSIYRIYMHYYGVSGWEICQGNTAEPSPNCFACSQATPRHRVVTFTTSRVSMYCSPNFKTKKALKDALKAGQIVTVFQPAGIGSVPQNGDVDLEGPHSPAPHTWYGEGTMQDGKLIKVK